jgi:flagellar motility protein MotE (MotC chaperone)
MDAATAAKDLAQMSEDLDLVCDILQCMSEKNAAAIMQEMDSSYAAQITKKISSVD